MFESGYANQSKDQDLFLRILNTIIEKANGSTDKIKESYLKELDELLCFEDLIPKSHAEVFKKLLRDFEVTGEASKELFAQNLPRLLAPESEPFETFSALRVATGRYLDDKKNLKTSNELSILAKKVRSEGLTLDDIEALRKYVKKEKEETEEQFDLLKTLEKNLTARDGYKFYIKKFDEEIGCIEEAACIGIFAFTNQGKTTLALNMCLKNALKRGKNSVYVSLEVPREQIYKKLFSMFAQMEGTGLNLKLKDLVSKDGIKSFLDKDTLDWSSSIRNLNDKFNKYIRSHVYVIDQEMMNDDISEGKLRERLERADREIFDGKLDGIFWDQLSLLKFERKGFKETYTGENMNYYMSFVRKLGVCFSRNEDGTAKKLTNFILAQANQAGYNEASKNKEYPGRYRLTAVAESNEMARASSYVVSLYNDEEMRNNNRSVVQLLKSRNGATFDIPVEIPFYPKVGLIGDDLGITLQDLSSGNLDDALKQDAFFNDVIDLIREDDFDLARKAELFGNDIYKVVSDEDCDQIRNAMDIVQERYSQEDLVEIH